MVTKKPKGLGRGLDALLGPSLSPGAADDAQAATPAGTPMMMSLADLRPGQYQPRTRMDEGALYELAESIKSQGIMQPILVRRLASKSAPALAGSADIAINSAASYEIIAGERRFRAARLAGLTEVPVLLRDVPDEAAAAMALIENIQREDLNPLEEAQGIQRLIGEFGLTHEQAAQAVGRSRSAASNLLRLLQLTEPVQTMLMAGDIDMGHARALLGLEGAAQITAANQVTSRKMSVREAEALVKRLGAEFNLTAPRKPAQGGADKPGDVRRVEEELSDLLTAQVEVRVKKRAKRAGRMEQTGEVAIQFGSLDELNGLIERLRALGGA
ncbi:ParB/RepB/Spo0J family partition protein [Ottowia sp.]|uniref:ParB/RepB/Spo0J family partition protein n=1 Tax=Ottowia sp. TaxID=1898956 RepID=UPI002C241D24|nr:ParB/RepB/Spo0J family partition protein [Ottowia sp.]HOB66700.1 ParB/RepB/Spo0J family partition protein [Ottowia sp.]HPZ55708.1 ParB/RepB/Spo0J family partition protein [Ottowia sp.]HQD46325.1 ParB/RepB/Spo0J family partition protein [Ottowia sp.]